jgi:hypothetical protein
MPTKPVIVGFFRGIAEAAAITGIGLLVSWLTTADLNELSAFVPAAVLGLRTLEGVADQRIDPTTQRGVLGGKPADLQ